MGIYTKNLNEELLVESVLYRSDESKQSKKDKFKISIRVDGSIKQGDGYLKDPYIKVENDSGYTKAGEELRFSMKTGKIIIHSGKKPMRYTKALGQLLNDIMDRESTNTRHYEGKTVYDAFYEDLQNRFSDKEIEKFDKPDFTVNS